MNVSMITKAILRWTLNLQAGLALLGLAAGALNAAIPGDPGTSYLKFGKPQNGDFFRAGDAIGIVLESRVPGDYLASADVLLNGQPIGYASYCCPACKCQQPLPGAPLPLTVWTGYGGLPEQGWNNPQPGRYKLSAQGITSAGDVVQADSIEVVVLPSGPVVEINVRAIDNEASEGPDYNVAIFEVSRTGSTQKPLTVWFNTDGSATRDLDYLLLTQFCTTPCRRLEMELTGNTLVIPEGANSIQIGVKAIHDDLLEGDESAALRLVDSPIAGPIPPYVLGMQSEDKVVIHDTPTRALLVITEPSDLQEFTELATFPIRAVALDPNGYIPRVEFYANEEKIGQSSLEFFAAPADGTPIHHAFDWEKVPAGKYLLTARAFTTAGEKLISDPVRIAVHFAQSTIPVVTIEASDRRATEKDPADIAIFEIHRRGDLSNPLEVAFDTDGSAKRGVDYVLIPEIMFTPCLACDRLENIITDNRIIFPANESSVRLGVRALSDDVNEGDETAIIRLLKPPTLDVTGVKPPYGVGQPGEDKFVITEDVNNARIPFVTVYSKKDRVKEWDPADELIFKFFRSGEVSQPLSVHFTLEGTATFGSDYVRSFRAEFAADSSGGADDQPLTHDSALPHRGIVNFSPGSSESLLIFHPIPEKMLEGDETVGVKIIFPPTDPLALARPTYVIGDPGIAKGVIVEKIPGPSIVIQEPVTGSRFVTGDDLAIRATAVDPDGAITHVVFYANGRVLGDSTITFIREPDPGVPIQHEFVWKNLPAGKYELTVQSEVGGLRVVSNPVIIAVEDALSLPVVTVSSPDGEASEPSPDRPDTATFVLTRTGSLDGPVTVVYAIEGTAQNGRDYIFLDGDATLPAGVATRRIQVQPLADRFIEGTETVLLTLKPGQSYKIGSDSSAQISILDADLPPDAKAAIVMTHPDDNAEFKAAATIPLRISTFDPNGVIAFAEFFANGEKIGEEGLVFPLCVGCGPKPGSVLTIPFIWRNVPAGQYKLTAQGKSSSGESVVSEAVSVVVHEKDSNNHAGELHPADLTPADSTLTVEEIKPYAFAWKNGTKWAVGPNPIPVSYVTRAGALWKGGEKYVYEPNAGPVPLAWINVPPVAAVPALDDGGIFIPKGEAIESARAESIALAQWALPAENDTPVQWVIRVLPAVGVQNYAVEERFPAGVKILDVSDDGTYDEVRRVVRWGPYFDATPRKFSFAFVGVRPETLDGIVSFDGHDARIVHVPLPPIPVPDAATAGGKEHSNGLRIAHVVRLGSGAIQLTVVDDSSGSGAGCDVEISDDFIHWQKVGHLGAGADCGTHLDNDANETAKRYYRVIRRQ